MNRDLDKILSFLPSPQGNVLTCGVVWWDVVWCDVCELQLYLLIFCNFSPFLLWFVSNSILNTARQTLLFSATFSKEVRAIAATTLRKGYTIVDTVGEEVEQTHSHGNYSFPWLLYWFTYSLTYLLTYLLTHLFTY